MKSKSRLALGLCLLLAVAGFFGWRNYSNRYLWPRRTTEWLLEPPMPDRSAWPKTPPPWKVQTNGIEVATPQGLLPRAIVYYENSIGMKFVRIEPGTFWMGLTEAQGRLTSAEKKIGCRVTLTKPYLLGAFEVTNEQYEKFDPSRAQRRPKYQRGAEGGQHPAEDINWRSAVEFCHWLSSKDGRVYRLPTEAEWEFACKAGTTNFTYWGDNLWDRFKANVGGLRTLPETYVEDGYELTAPVGLYPPNPWGLYDMIGNSWEWVHDWFDWYPTAPLVDPQGPPTGHMRVKKGASWSTRTRDLKSCARDGNNPADLFEIEGFRVLCEVPADGVVK
jgi:formylglycine-generating enzyme required for sulfatase activity